MEIETIANLALIVGTILGGLFVGLQRGKTVATKESDKRVEAKVTEKTSGFDAILTSHAAMLDDLKRDNAEKDDTIAAMQAVQAERTAAFAKMQERVEGQEEALKAQRAELNAANDKIATANAKIATLERQVDTLRSEKAEIAHERDGLRREVADLKAELKTARDHSRDQDMQIVELRAELRAYKSAWENVAQPIVTSFAQLASVLTPQSKGDTGELKLKGDAAA
jgi:chromosome segregation ATPase